jgi:hypothetical protein
MCSKILTTLEHALKTYTSMGQEQIFYLWTFMEFLAFYNSVVTLSNLFQELLEKLAKHNSNVFKHYQGYLEHPDKNRLALIHRENPNLHVILVEFVGWYYDEAQPSRTQNLLEAVARLEGKDSEMIFRGEISEKLGY